MIIDVFCIDAAFINYDCRMTVCVNNIHGYLLVGLCTFATVFIVTESLNDLNSEKTKMGGDYSSFITNSDKVVSACVVFRRHWQEVNKLRAN